MSRLWSARMRFTMSQHTLRDYWDMVMRCFQQNQASGFLLPRMNARPSCQAPTNFVPYTQFTYLFIYYIVTLDENDDLITSFEVALQTIRKVKARVIEFWDSLFPDWRNFRQNDLKIESLKCHKILFGSTHGYRSLGILPTEL